MVRKATILTAIAVAFPMMAGAADIVMPPGSSFGGQSPSQLSADWWQWAKSIPSQTNPVRDLTGANCAVGQQGAVWFLAGGFGSSKIHRICTIPDGKAAFFPIINMAYWRPKKSGAFTCDQAKAFASLNNDTALDLFAEVDGVQIANLKQYRVSSDRCFDIFGRMPEGQRPYDAYPSASDGYWLLLKPLSSGRHTLKFGGRYNRNSAAYGRMVQDIEYELIVK